ERELDDWLARAAAYETAAGPPAVAGPGVVDGLARQALAQEHQAGLGLQPNSTHCFVCGLHNPYGLKMRFLQVEPQRVRAYAVVPEVYQGYPGVVHGGVLAAMLDEVTGRAASGTDPETARLFYTLRLTLRYRHATPTQRLLRLEGWVTKDKGRVVSAQGAVYDAATGQRYVEAEALLMALPDDVRSQLDPDALGWKIYPLDL
ncbi:MAG: PaaI family thioesterase, partial [Chloroflexi bacterium]|nr:PaaI family thioesterase [Chloroflexota bacterium]